MKIGFQNTHIMICRSLQIKIVLLLMLVVTTAAADSILAADCASRIYGTAYDGPNAPAIFYSINISNGVGTQIGPVGFDRISAMDVDPTSGILYAIAERHSDDQTVLISINRLNGVGTQVAEVSFGTDPDFEHIAGMSFDSLGNLYGFGSSDQGFYAIDVTDGTVLLLGVYDLGLPGNGLAFSPDDTLYHADDEFLSTVNLATGALTHVNDLTFNFVADSPKVAAMDYGPETGLYYAIIKDGAEASLATVDVGTGTVDRVGFTADYMDGLAYFYCEPVITDAAIAIEKATNGFDADTGTGPLLGIGQAVTWTYVVTNTGNVKLDPVVVEDNIAGVSPVCDATSLAVGASLTCSATGVATAGQYANVGTATGTPPEGDDVVATDPSHYLGAAAAITIEKATNGFDADTGTGPVLGIGQAVTWTYVVNNTGNVKLDPVVVEDNIAGVNPVCNATSLAVGASLTCSATGVATAGQYANVGTATGTPPEGDDVVATDPSHYFGASEFNIDYGLNGNWWNGSDRSGEGIQVEISGGNGSNLVLVASFYSYDTMGNQIFMIMVGPVSGDTAEVEIFITTGGLWGDNFDPNLVVETQWGTGTVRAFSCEAMEMELRPNDEYRAQGYTDLLMYDLERLPGIVPVAPCPIDAPND